MKDSRMDFFERITLSPFYKYARFNRFPYKFVTHLLLIALTTYQALQIVSIQDKHTRIQEYVFSTIYIQTDDGSSSFPFYSLSAFTDSFFQVINNTLTLDQTLLQYSDIASTRLQLLVYYNYVSAAQFDQGITTIYGDLHSFIPSLYVLGISPGDYPHMKDFLQKVERLALKINNLQTFVAVDSEGNRDACLNWTITLQYSFQSFANVYAFLEADSYSCRIDYASSASMSYPSLVAIHIAVMLCSGFSLLLSWRQVYRVSRDYLYQGKKGRSQILDPYDPTADKSYQALGFFYKLRFFDFWFLVIIAGNFFQFFGGFVALLDYFVHLKLAVFAHKYMLIGFGVMLAWVTLLKYLEYSNSLNLMTATLAKSWGNLFVFLVGVMPFFLGFVFLGQSIFWKYNKFEDTSSTVVTLFALLNGDIVNDTFLETWAEGLPGQIYLIVFMVLFYTAVQNVFVTIIMEGYEESVKEREYKRQLQSKEQADREGFDRCLQLIDLEPPSADHSSFVNEVVEINQTSPTLSEKQQTAFTLLHRNSKKIDLILTELDKLKNQIAQSTLTPNEKAYLQTTLKDNLTAITRNIKLQIEDIDK